MKAVKAVEVGPKGAARVESWRWQRLAELMAIAQRRIWERESAAAASAEGKVLSAEEAS